MVRCTLGRYRSLQPTAIVALAPARFLVAPWATSDRLFAIALGLRKGGDHLDHDTAAPAKANFSYTSRLLSLTIPALPIVAAILNNTPAHPLARKRTDRQGKYLMHISK